MIIQGIVFRKIVESPIKALTLQKRVPCVSLFWRELRLPCCMKTKASHQDLALLEHTLVVVFDVRRMQP